MPIIHCIFTGVFFVILASWAFADTQVIIPNVVNNGKPNFTYLDSVYKKLQAARQTGSVNPQIEADQLMTLLLAGENRYQPLWDIIAKTGQTQSRFALVKLLGGVRRNEAEKLLIMLVGDANSLVQGEAVRQLRARELAPDRLGAILVKQIAYLNTDKTHNSLTHQYLLRNKLLSGRVEIIRTLAEIQYQPAVSALEKLLRQNIVFAQSFFIEIATMLHRLGSDAFAPYFNSALIGAILVVDPKEGVKPAQVMLAAPVEVIKRIGQWRVTACRGALEAYLLKGQRHQNTLETYYATQALIHIGDDGSAAIIHARLKAILQKKHPSSEDLDNLRNFTQALVKLKFKPARKSIEQAMHYNE